jgi:hypothetical protein
MQISHYRIAWRDLQTNRTGAGDYVFSYKVASEISNDLNRIYKGKIHHKVESSSIPCRYVTLIAG